MDSPPFTAGGSGVVDIGMTETEGELGEMIIVGESEVEWLWFGAEGEWDPLRITTGEFVGEAERDSEGGIVDPWFSERV